MAFNLANSPFSATSSWNTPVNNNASYTKLNWAASTGYNYGASWDSYSPAVYEASSTDPAVQVSVPEGWGYPGGTISVHMPTAANGAAGSDGELIVIDGNTVYNFWQFDRTSATTATASAYGETNVATGTGWGTQSPFQSAGITAVGSSELGGLLVQAETDTGSINHALQLVVDSNLVQSGFTGNAIAGDGGSGSGIVQEGEHVAIAPGTPMPSGLSTLGQEVFRALQQYGAYVVDVAGGATNIRVQANAYDASTINALDQDMGSITPLLEKITGGTPASTSSSGTGTTTSSGTGTTIGSDTGTTTGSGTGTTTSSGSTHPVAPTLTVTDHSLSVSPGDKVSLGIGVSVPNASDNVSVTISGLPKYETITDKLDGKTFSGSSVTLTAAEVNSGLTLNNSYQGHGHPSATLTVTAHDATGTPITSAAQTITVKDPPATTNSGSSTTSGGSTSSGGSHHHGWSDHHHHHHAVATTSSGTSTTTSGQSSSQSQAGHSNIAQWFNDHPGFAHVATTLSEAGASRSSAAHDVTSATSSTPSAGARAYALLNQMMAGDFSGESHFAQAATALPSSSHQQANLLTRPLH